MGVTEIIGLLLGVVDKVLDRLPTYDQKKKEQYFKLRQEYEEELKKDFPERDDSRILDLRDELLNFVSSFKSLL